MGDSESALSGQCKDGQKSERRHMINMIMMSVCFFFTFSAFTALQNLQASLNKTGKTCLAVLYGLLMVSCFITPPLVQRLSPKKTMVLCLIVHCVFTAANYYPVEYSLVPACALLGLASAPLWTAQQTYLASSAHMHAAQRPERILDEVLNRFNGIFFLIFQCTQVCAHFLKCAPKECGSILRQLFGMWIACVAVLCSTAELWRLRHLKHSGAVFEMKKIYLEFYDQHCIYWYFVVSTYTGHIRWCQFQVSHFFTTSCVDLEP